jgi:hypothetical protein
VCRSHHQFGRLVAAQNLKRQWIGIDISPTACRVMANRLRDPFQSFAFSRDRLAKVGRGCVRDLPQAVENWRCNYQTSGGAAAR